MPFWDDKKLTDGVVLTETAAKGTPFVAPAGSTVLNPGQIYYSVDPSAKTEAVYTPTHLPLAEPRRVNFSGQDEIYNSEAMHKRIRRHFQGMMLNDAHMLPPAWFPEDGARPRFVCNAPDWDVFRYIVELSDPDVFQYELNRALNDVPGVPRRLDVEFEEAQRLRGDLRPDVHHFLNDREIMPSNALRPSYKPWYKGFVDDTWINCWVRGSGGSGLIELYDYESGYFKQNRVSAVLPIVYRKENEKSKIWVSKRYLGGGWKDEDYCIVQPTDGKYPSLRGYLLGDKMLRYDMFHHIGFHSFQSDLILNKFSMKLNGEIICESWDIEDIEHRMSPENPYDGSEIIYKYKQSLLDYPSEMVLRLMINELGQAWKFKWMCEFEKGWCGPFNDYVLDRATTLFPNRGYNEGYTRERFGFWGRLISPWKGVDENFSNFTPTSWQDLGSTLKPGFKARMLTNYTDDITNDVIYHITTFINWNNITENPISRTFKGLGGNQSGRVNIGEFKCINRRVNPGEPYPIGVYYPDREEYFADTLPPYYQSATGISTLGG